MPKDNEVTYTIEEAKQKKIKCQNDIAQILKDFTDSTGLTVSGVYIDNIMRGDRDFPIGYVVNMGAKL